MRRDSCTLVIYNDSKSTRCLSSCSADGTRSFPSDWLINDSQSGEHGTVQLLCGEEMRACARPDARGSRCSGHSGLLRAKVVAATRVFNRVRASEPSVLCIPPERPRSFAVLPSQGYAGPMCEELLYPACRLTLEPHANGARPLTFAT